MAEYKIALEKLKKAGIEPKVGNELVLVLTGGKKVNVKITKVEKETVIATIK